MTDTCDEAGMIGLTLECSGHCSGGIRPECFDAACGTRLIDKPELGGLERLPTAIRTPELSGVDPNCAADCVPPGTAYALALRVNLMVIPPNGFELEVRARPPWRVALSDQCVAAAQTSADCVASTSGLFFSGFTGAIWVLTDDPFAPARNIVVDWVPSAEACQ